VAAAALATTLLPATAATPLGFCLFLQPLSLSSLWELGNKEGEVENDSNTIQSDEHQKE
jgi:hypothetical protein